MSRLQTGTVTPIIRETDLDEVIPTAPGGVPEDTPGGGLTTVFTVRTTSQRYEEQPDLPAATA